MPIEEDLQILDIKMKQLRLDYERYFLGTRPREPSLLRSDVEKLVTIFSNQAIKNTALRFKFQSLCSRYQAYKRQWTETLRKMDSGTYGRHRFKADLHESAPTSPPPVAAGSRAKASSEGGDLFDAYVEARRSCGQDVESLSQAKLQKVLNKQKKQLGGEVSFRVVVEGGKAKIKASRNRGD
ncbi:MAG: MXAN_5187 C-terminal domain-containing protein [Myxococcota bacterium]